MRLKWTLFLSSVLLGAGAQAMAAVDGPSYAQITAAPEARNVEKRQDVGSGSSADPPGDGTGSGSASSSSSSSSSSALTSSSSSSSSSPAQDTTVTRTVTVDGSARVVTRTTTVVTTVDVTTTSISTRFSTSRTTVSNRETATSVKYTTSTVTITKRAADPTLFPARAVGLAAAVTHVPSAGLFRADGVLLDRRDTITNFVTVTGDPGDASTTTTTVRSTRSNTITSSSISTQVVTETVFLDAKTTVTTTSTRLVTSTQTGAAATTTGNGSASSDGAGSGSSGGLTNGAKIGIGVGVGVGGLVVIAAALFFFCFRKRSPKPVHDDYMGQSEVPVGSSPGGPPAMSTTSAYMARAKNSIKSSNVSAEGYRGTAMGDGRSGYAKPQTYGAAYSQAGNTSPNGGRFSTMHSTSDRTHTLPSTEESTVYGNGQGSPGRENAAQMGDRALPQENPLPDLPDGVNEMDGGQGVTRQSGNVYEMPATNQG